MSIKTAIGSWAYCFGPYEDHPVPLDETIRKLKELEFDGVEMCGFPPHFSPDLYPTAAEREKVKAMLDEAGLGVAGYAANFMDTPPAVTPKKEYLAAVQTNIEMCQAIGCPKLRVDTVSGPFFVEEGNVSYDDAWRNVSSVWREAAQLCEDNGILLVWEFEPGFLFNKPSEVVKMVDAVGHPNFKILFDACHAHMCAVVAARQPGEKETLPGGAVEFAKMLKGQIGHIHLIDSDETLHDNETSTHRPFGEGVLDFDEIVPAILEAGYDDEWWSVDLCFWPEAWEVTANAKKFLDQLIAKYGS